MATEAPATIYVVDDDEVVRDSLKALLESRHFNVLDFESGQEFLERWAASAAACLILDVHMAGMSGLELLKILRNQGDSVPTVFITGRIDPTVRAEAKALGAVATLDKPVSHQLLFATIQQALASRAP